MDQIWIDGIFGNLWNDPHDRTVPTTNDSNNWMVVLCEMFEVLEALLSIFAHVVKEEAEVVCWKVEVEPINLI